MFKKLSFSALFFISSYAFAQNPTQKIIVEKGQVKNSQDSMTVHISQDLMGQSVEFNISNITTNVLEIKNIADNKTTVTATLTNVKSSFEGMGKSETYNSDKPEDKNSEMAKAYADKLNKPIDYVIDSKGKDISPEKPVVAKEGDDSNPLAGMMNMAGSAGNPAEIAFMILPADSKKGSTWTDTLTNNGIKTSRTYIIKSIENNIASITLLGVISGTTKIEMMGQEVNATMGGKVDGEITVDIKTGALIRNSTVTQMDNSIEVMGMTVPVTGTVGYVVNYK